MSMPMSILYHRYTNRKFLICLLPVETGRSKKVPRLVDDVAGEMELLSDSR